MSKPKPACGRRNRRACPTVRPRFEDLRHETHRREQKIGWCSGGGIIRRLPYQVAEGGHTAPPVGRKGIGIYDTTRYAGK